MNRIEQHWLPRPGPKDKSSTRIGSLVADLLTLIEGRALDAFVAGLSDAPQSIPASTYRTRRRGKPLAIVIPCRSGTHPRVTLQSLARQTFRDFDVIVSDDRGRGANWARNRGFKLVQSEFVLFSDNDVEWYPDALRQLKVTLDAHPRASYSYGSYLIPGVGRRADVAFDPNLLRRLNYISTMSMIRTADFPGFDESIRRFQDWDLWLTLLSRGKGGVHCGASIFQTRLRRGITYGSTLSAEEATRVIKSKHSLRR
jgi:Glycosyl transferase family 2